MGDEVDRDRLSQLPSDVLVSILHNLDLRDAVRSAVLSRRWRRLHAQLPRLVLDIDDFLVRVRLDDPHHARRDDDTMSPQCPPTLVKEQINEEEDIVLSLAPQAAASDVLVEAATALLASRSSAGDCPISTLAVRFILWRSDDRVARLIDDAVAAGKLRAAELTVVTEKDALHCTIEEEKEYASRLLALLDAFPRAFAVLTRLSLENIKVANPSQLRRVIAACANLRFLFLDNCEAGPPLTTPLEMRHPKLADVKLTYCNFSTVNLHWLPELVSLEICNWFGTSGSMLPVHSGHVPRLTKLALANTAVDWQKPFRLSDLLANTAVSDLRINFQAENIWVKPEPQTRLRRVLRNVRRLNIRNVHDRCDLSWTLFLLEAAPLLEDLYIKVWSHACRDKDTRQEREGLRNKSDLTWESEGRIDTDTRFQHHGLTRLTIFGFRSNDKRVIKFVRRVVQVAPRLQDICLRDKKRCDYCGRIVHPCLSFPRTDMEKDMIRKRIIAADGRRALDIIKFIGNN